MLWSIIGGGDFRGALISILIRIPAVLLAISVHEAAHGYAAYKLGDPTAKYMGRLTLNPAAHFDPIGVLCMLFAGFGWAKPVMFDTRNFKHPKRDVAITAAAGPVANLILAFVTYVLIFVLVMFVGAEAKLMQILYSILWSVVSLNISLMVFNFVPIPPLDGSKILITLLPNKAHRFWLQYERWGFIILVVALMLGLLDTPISFVYTQVIRLFNYIVGGVFGLFM